jgi:hypothetical protein
MAITARRSDLHVEVPVTGVPGIELGKVLWPGEEWAMAAETQCIFAVDTGRGNTPAPTAVI